MSVTVTLGGGPVVFANASYVSHMTDEGLQLQEGLRLAGWNLVGKGYHDGERDTIRLLKRWNPDRLFIQDKRDWDPASGCPGSDASIAFKNIEALATYPGKTFILVKDAGREGLMFHRQHALEVKADAAVIYYHPLSVLKYSHWLTDYKLVRTYHTLNPEHVPPFTPGRLRMPICSSGATMQSVYPLRHHVATHAAEFGVMHLQHPGYENTRGPHTERYLSFLNQFKVSFATASSYGFALRKIIEGVACGCTVVTDLPKYDVLPEIDRALIRVKSSISDQDLKTVFREAVANWDEDGRRRWAQKAIDYYHYLAEGRRLSQALQEV